MEALTFKPEEWGMKRGTENEDFMFLNLGRTTRRRTGLSVSFCNSMAKRLSTAYQTSVTTTVVRRKWANASLAQLHSVY